MTPIRNILFRRIEFLVIGGCVAPLWSKVHRLPKEWLMFCCFGGMEPQVSEVKEANKVIEVRGALEVGGNFGVGRVGYVESA